MTIMNYLRLVEFLSIWITLLISVNCQTKYKWATDEGHDDLKGQLTMTVGSVDACVSSCYDKGLSSCTAAGFLKSGGSVKCGHFPGGSSAVSGLRRCATVSRNNAAPDGAVALAYCMQKTDATGKTESATSGYNDGECFMRNVKGKCALFALDDCSVSGKEYYNSFLDCIRYAPGDPTVGDGDSAFLVNNGIEFGDEVSKESSARASRRQRPALEKQDQRPICGNQGPTVGTILLIGGVTTNRGAPPFEAYVTDSQQVVPRLTGVFDLPSLASQRASVHVDWLNQNTLILTNEQSTETFLIDINDPSAQPATGPLNQRIRSFGSAACGRFLMCGGILRGSPNSLESCEIFDTANDEWIDGNSMVEAREAASMVSLNTSVVVIGGWNGFTNSHTNSIETLDNMDKVLQDRPRWRLHSSSLLQRRSEHASVNAGSFIVTCGGRSDQAAGGVLNSCEAFSPQDGRRNVAFPPMNEPRAGFSMVVENSRIYALGGYRLGRDGGFIELYSVEFIDLASLNRGWRYEPALFDGRFNYAAVVV